MQTFRDAITKSFYDQVKIHAATIYRRYRTGLQYAGYDLDDFSSHSMRVFLGRMLQPDFDPTPYLDRPSQVFLPFLYQRAMEILRKKRLPQVSVAAISERTGYPESNVWDRLMSKDIGHNAASPQERELELKELLHQALSDLEPSMRRVAAMRFHWGEKPNEIATALGMPVAEVYSLIRIAKDKIRETLSRHRQLAEAI